MIDNMRYISLLVASVYNTCYISRACTLLSINASICLAWITRVIHLLMHCVCMAGGAALARLRQCLRVSVCAPRAASVRRLRLLGDAVGIACVCSVYCVDDYTMRT